MKSLSTIYFSIFFSIVLLFITCKKDCNSKYTIKGTVWNGTTNKPRSFIDLSIGAGGRQNFWGGSANAKDFGTVKTDANGKFSLDYTCSDDSWEVSIYSTSVPGENIGGNLPINQNIDRIFNISDSITVNVYIKQISSFATNDTVYINIRGATDFIELYYSDYPFYRIYNNSSVKTGLFKTIRLKYRGDNFPVDNIIYFKLAKGYNNYIKAIHSQPVYSIYISNMEPDSNNITLSY